MSLTVADLEKVQAQLGDDYRVELINGEIVLMNPSGYESDEIAARVIGKLFPYVDSKRLGRITASSAGFSLPNSDTRAPDVSFVTAERLRRSPRKFAQLAPDLMVEVKSPEDSVQKLRDKIDDFLQQGTQVGILIHPEQRWIEIRRLNQESVTLRDGAMLTIPDLLPGWSVEVSELWPPVFDDGQDTLAGDAEIT